MDKHKAMNHALKDRRTNGLDINIIVHDGTKDGGNMDDAKAKEESKQLGLAPDAPEVKSKDDGGVPQVAQGNDYLQRDEQPGMPQNPAHMDSGQDSALIEQELAKAGLGKGSVFGKSQHKKDMGKK